MIRGVVEVLVAVVKIPAVFVVDFVVDLFGPDDFDRVVAEVDEDLRRLAEGR